MRPAHANAGRRAQFRAVLRRPAVVLVVYVPGHLDDLGRLMWLLEAAERLAARVRDEVTEAAAAR
jgi:hypothetical protein